MPCAWSDHRCCTEQSEFDRWSALDSNMPSAYILVVEDDNTIAMGLGGRSGARAIRSASTWTRARMRWRAVQERTPDLVISDIMLAWWD